MGFPVGALGGAHAVIDVARQGFGVRAHLASGGCRPLEAMLQEAADLFVWGQVSFRHGLAFLNLRLPAPTRALGRSLRLFGSSGLFL